MLSLILPLVLVVSQPVVQCTPEEYAYYESQGWDAYECDGDKAAALEKERK